MFHGWFSFKVMCVISIKKFNFCNKVVPFCCWVEVGLCHRPLDFWRYVNMQFIEPFRKVGGVQTLNRRTAVATETIIFLALS